MNKVIGMLSLIFLLVACDRIEGTLKLDEAVTLTNTKGIKKSIAVNSYDADIKLKSKKSITLRLSNDSDEKFEFKIPSGKPIPNNGAFVFTSKEVGQPVDLEGTVKTVVTRSATVTSWEICQYTEYQTVCHSGPDGKPICTTVPVQRNGQELVRYYDETIEKDVLMAIRNPGSSSIAGDFVGDIAYSQRVYTSRSGCR